MALKYGLFGSCICDAIVDVNSAQMSMSSMSSSAKMTIARMAMLQGQETHLGEQSIYHRVYRSSHS
jgi:glutamate synthase domain-containing protein 2